MNFNPNTRLVSPSPHGEKPSKRDNKKETERETIYTIENSEWCNELCCQTHELFVMALPPGGVIIQLRHDSITPDCSRTLTCS